MDRHTLMVCGGALNCPWPGMGRGGPLFTEYVPWKDVVRTTWKSPVAV
jgi:hypothetical protein